MAVMLTSNTSEYAKPMVRKICTAQLGASVPYVGLHCLNMSLTDSLEFLVLWMTATHSTVVVVVY